LVVVSDAAETLVPDESAPTEEASMGVVELTPRKTDRVGDLLAGKAADGRVQDEDIDGAA
jgi:hypothetical protein